MKRLPMSRAAAGLLRNVLNRAETERDRILLTEIKSTDWQSLTYIGEQHRLSFRVTGADSRAIVHRIADGLEEAAFTIPGQIVADVALSGEPRERDGMLCFTIEALTIAE